MEVKCTQQLKIYEHNCHKPHLHLLFYFRMALNKSLNIACDLDEYLFCRMPTEALEVKIKVKTKWGKFSMLQDTHTRTEKYCAWEKADRRSNVRTRKRKTPNREMRSIQAEDNTSETDVPVGQGFRYPPQVFTDPKYAAAVPHMEKEEEQAGNKNCNKCNKCGKMYCWCNSSDWEEGLLNVEKPNSNPSIEKTPSPTVRKPPVQWTAQRYRVVMAARENRQNMDIEQARPPSPEEEFSTDSKVSKNE